MTALPAQQLRARQLILLGACLLLPMAATVALRDLRANTAGFLALYSLAVALYGAATILALRLQALSTTALAALFLLAAAMMALLLLTRPALSDDMYRYIWDGRVQWQGISPYRYPPNAPELQALRDADIWPHINRKSAVTIYPPVAQMAFALLWRLVPDSVRWFQIVAALSALLGGGLLVGLLRALGRSPARVIIYLWAPLLIFETAHSAHLDALILPILVGAWWARAGKRDLLTGLLLGLATALKLYPALLLPALWRPDDRRGRWAMPAAFLLTVLLSYLPYVAINGRQVLGFLPQYLGERFNMGLAGLLVPLFRDWGLDPNLALLGLTAGLLGALSLWMVLRPAGDGETALRRCIWLIGAYTLLTQNLFSWYLLWLLPLVAIFLRPIHLPGLRVDAWTGWWLFTGLIGLSYSFFMRWRPVPWAIWAQYLPLYLLLALDAGRWIQDRLLRSNWPAPAMVDWDADQRGRRSVSGPETRIG